MKTVHEILNDPRASIWIRHAIATALARDPTDAVDDARRLCGALELRAEEVSRGTEGTALDSLVVF